MLAQLYPQFEDVDSSALTPYVADLVVHKEEDVEMMHPTVSRTDTFRSMVDLDSAWGADHDDSPFVGSYTVIIFFMACMGG